MLRRGPIATISTASAETRHTIRSCPTRIRRMPVSSRSSGSPSSGSLCSLASAARTFRLGSGASCRTTSDVSRGSTTRRLRTACRDLLSEQLIEVVRAAFATIQCAPVAEDLGVELGIGHDFECCVQTRRFVVAHEDRSRTPMFCDGDAFVATRDIVDESAELRLRLGQRQRLHDLTSLQTNRGNAPQRLRHRRQPRPARVPPRPRPHRRPASP